MAFFEFSEGGRHQASRESREPPAAITVFKPGGQTPEPNPLAFSVAMKLPLS